MNESAGRFPASELRTKGGEIYCSIFENPSIGLKRSLFWALTLFFEPVGKECETVMTCEWIPWTFRRWMELDGVSLTIEQGENGIEGSFYVCGHNPMKKATIAVRHVRGNFFEMEMEMTVEYLGSEFSSPEPYMTVKGCTVVPFAGLYLGAGISFDDVSEFIDLSVFEHEPSNNKFGVPYYKPKMT